MSETADEMYVAAHSAFDNPEVMTTITDALKGSSRRKRQKAAQVLKCAAHIDAAKLEPFADDLIDALNRPEAQTRWECLEALTLMVDVNSRACDRALDGAETALFDEDNSLLRLAAVRFLCKLGATTEKRSEKTWPLLDEAIQCYHGDPGFHEMLASLAEYSTGKIAPSVKEELRARMTFDAENGKGTLKTRAKQIVENLS